MSGLIHAFRTPAETALIEYFGTERTRLPGATDARASAFARFSEKGLPSRRVESYHYTDLRQIWRSPALPGESARGVVPPGGTDEAAAFRFHNGQFLGASSLPDGVTATPLADALAAGRVILGAAMGAAEDVVVDINTAFVREGVVVHVPEGAKLAVPLMLAFDHDGESAELCLPRVILTVGAGADVTLIETLTGNARQVNSVVEILIGAGARVGHIRINQAGPKGLVLSTLAATLAEQAELNTLCVTLGAETSRHQVFVTYAGEYAKAAIRGATLLKGAQHHDTTLVVDHAAAHGESRELFRTVLDGAAQGVFQGKIIVRPGAQKTDGQMASNAILLSDEAGMANKPELEIFADDVVCAHGATCGALDESQVFYLMARGLPRVEAEALLVQAFVGEVLDTLEDEPTREALGAQVAAWMAGRGVRHAL